MSDQSPLHHRAAMHNNQPSSRSYAGSKDENHVLGGYKATWDSPFFFSFNLRNSISSFSYLFTDPNDGAIKGLNKNWKAMTPYDLGQYSLPYTAILKQKLSRVTHLVTI